MSARPGPLAFLFTDVEGSTRLWEAHPERMPAAIARHDELLTAAVGAAGGAVFKFGGDSCHAVFEQVDDALVAAVDGLQRLAAEAWSLPQPVRVRMAVHLGFATARDGDYWGTTLNRLARLLALGHGGQVLVSAAAVEGASAPPAGWQFVPLGEYELRDLRHPEPVSELCRVGQVGAFPALRAPVRRQHNLPPLLSACLGRDADLAVLGDLLRQHRLVSLVGSGGCGKTRLALELAYRANDAGTACWLVELGPLADPRRLDQAVAAVLGVGVAAGQSHLAATLEYLRGRSLWLLLDNCEHLLDGVATLCAELLSQCPGVRLLCTSREPLGVAGEQVHRVPSLPLPPAAQSVDALLANPAVALFLERAAAVGTCLPTDAVALGLVAEICRRLDGLPLALELAAARSRAMPLPVLAERLSQRFRVLTGGRAALSRHRTLEAAVAWSFDLLQPRERELLKRLSVFAGTWQLADVLALCPDDDDLDLLDALASLVDKSLVQFDGESLYSLLETIRQYAGDQLAAETTAVAVRDRHAARFAALASAVYDDRLTVSAVESCRQLRAAQENLRSALSWYCESGAAGPALALAGRLYWFWDHTGAWQEGLDALTAALALPGGTAGDRALCLQGQGLLAMHLGRLSEAAAADRAGMLLCEQIGDRRGYCRLQHNLGRVAQRQDDLATAERLIQLSLTEQRTLDDPEGFAISLQSLGNLHAVQGRHEAARGLLDAALAQMRVLGDASGIAYCLASAGNVARLQGRLDEALRLLHDSATQQRDHGDQRGLMFALANLGVAARAAEQTQLARDCYEEGLDLASHLGDRSAEAVFQTNLGGTLVELGEYGLAEPRLTASLALCDQLGAPRTKAFALRNLGTLARQRGELASAVRRYRESLLLRHELADQPGYAELWEALAALLDPPIAAQLLGAADRLRSELGQPRTPAQDRDLSAALAAAEAQLDPATWRAAVATGARWSDDQVLQLVLGECL